MMKLLPVLGFYGIDLDEYEMLKTNITYPVLCINKKYILKRVPSEIVVNEVLFKYLIEKGNINVIVLNKYERVFTYYDSCFWILTKKVKGVEFDYSVDNHLLESSKYLSEIISNNIDIGDISFHDNFSIEKWYKNPKKMMDKTLELISHYYGNVSANYCSRLLKVFQSMDFYYSNYEKFRIGLSHGEFQNTNIFFDDGCIKIIDYDSLSLRPHIFEIISSASYLCRKKRGGFEIDQCKVKVYLQNFDLNKSELNDYRNMIFLNFVPKEDSIEKHYVMGREKLYWYLNWTLEAMEVLLDELIIEKAKQYER